MIDEPIPASTFQFCQLTCPPAITQPNDPGQCTALVYGGLNVTWTGSCTVSDLTWSVSGATPADAGPGQIPTPYTFYVGVSYVTYVMDDGTGMPSTCSIQVTINDTEPPVIQCPADIILSCATLYFPPDSSSVIATDNCDPDVVVGYGGETYLGLGEEPGWCPDTIYRSYTATDDAGNTSICVQTIIIQPDEYCNCEICQDSVPHFQVDLSADCDAVFVVEDVGRHSLCCDASWPDRCISFSVMIGEGSIGVYIEITKGAVPPGWWWQVDCGDSVAWNEIICIPPNEYHTITMCKAGSNLNTYELRAVCGIVVPDTISTRTDCAMPLSVSGEIDSTTVTWTSIWPGEEGQYNQYLSCDSGCLTTLFIPDQNSPPEIWYLVCGDVPGYPCPGMEGSSTVCDTVVAYVYPLVEITIVPYPPIFCIYDPHVITAYVTPESEYDIRWWDDINGTGNVLSTEYTFTPSEAGWYSVTVVDTGNLLPCGYDTLNFEVTLLNCLTCPTQYHCDSSEIVRYQTVSEFVGAGGVLNYPCSVPDNNILLLSEETDGLSCPETIIHTYEIWDECDNHDTCYVFITLDDTIPPLMACPPVLNGICSIIEISPYATLDEFIAAGGSASDNCELDPSSFQWISDVTDGNTCPETFQRTYQVADLCGNTASCAQTVIIDDNIPPVLTCPTDYSVECLEDIPACDPGLAIVTDNCDLTPTVTCAQGPLVGGPCGGTVTVTFTAEDDCGNVTTCNQVITVNDLTAPTADSLPDLGPFACYEDIPAPDIDDVTGEADNCLGPVTVTFAGDSPDPGCAGFVTRTYELTDQCGNTDMITQLISILDTISPTADPLPPLGPYACYKDIPPQNIEDVTGESDNCGGPVTVSFVEDTPAPACEGLVTRTYQLADECGNTVLATQEISIEYEDFTMPPDESTTVACYGDVIEPVPPVVHDLCDTLLAPSGPVIGGTYIGCEGTVTYTWNYTDCEGNTHDWIYTYTIEIEDFLMPPDTGTTVACYSQVVEPVPPVVYDYCGNLITPSGPVSGGTYAGCEGTVTYTWNYADCEGNAHDWVFTYTVEFEDFTMPADSGTIVACYNDAVEPLPPAVYDYCNSLIDPTGPVIGGTYAGCEGTVTYTWSYADCEGSNHDWVFTYTIEYEPFEPIPPTADTADCYENIILPGPPVVYDNCGIEIFPSGPVESAPVNCEGEVVYTWTYSDCEGNTQDYIHTVTVEYEDFTLPANDSATVSCYNDATEPVPPVVTDNCGLPISPSGPVIGGTYAGCEGTVTYTWTYVDCEGNSNDWTYTYTIEYEDFTMPADDGTTVECYQEITEPVPPVVYDNCGMLVTPVGPAVGGTYAGCEGTVTYAWTYTDCEGNSHDWTYTYTIEYEDFQLPPDDGTTVPCYSDATEPLPPVVFDNCGQQISPSGPVLGGTYDGCEGTVTYTWTYADCEGNTHDWNFTYTIEYEPFGAIPPTSDIVDCFESIVLPDPPVVTDNCGILIIPSGPVVGGSYSGCEGDVTFTWTYTDCEGNSQDYVHTVTIEYEDFIMPPDEGTIVPCYSEATEPVPPTVYDHCDSLIMPSGPVIGGTYAGCEGTVTYTWTFMDCEGNSHNWVYTYTIEYEDFTMPANEDSTVSCHLDAIEPVPPVVYDNCDQQVNPSGPVIGGTYSGCEGTVTYTWTYTDCEGNSHDWVYTYTIEYEDFTMPADDGITVECYTEATVPVPPIVYDNCDNLITPVGPVTGGTYAGCEGTVTFTWNYTDCEGNSHDWTYTYTIEYEDFTLPADDGTTVDCYNEITVPVPPVVYDNCGMLIDPSGPAVGGTYTGCEGTVTYTWTYTDCEGNSHDWVFTYLIEYEDFIMPADSGTIVACYNDAVQPVPPAVYDNCGAAVTPSGPVTGGTYMGCEGTVTYTWTYNDCEGNSHDWTFTYTIEYEPFGPIPSTTDSYDCYMDIVLPDPPVVFDNCGMQMIPTGPVESLPADCEGVITYTWTYTDCEGNAQEYVHAVTIEYQDFIMPADEGSTISCYSEAIEPIPPTVYDSCQMLIIPTGPVIGGTYAGCEGTVTFTWNYEDCEGNNHFWVYTYTIEYEDFIMPADEGTNVSCYDEVTEPVPPVAYDNCGMLIVPSGPVIGGTYTDCEGTVTYVWKYSDCEGNSHDWTYTYYIDDETPPVISCPGNLSAICSVTEQPAYATFQDFVSAGGSASDNCGLDESSFTLISEISDGVNCPETITRTYQIADICGNTAVCTQLILVDDDILPVISCPPDTVVVAWDDIPPALLTLQEFIDAGGSVSDNCGIADFQFLSEEEVINGQCPRLILRVYMTGDSCGNTATCIHTISQDDDTPPEVTCPPEISVVCASDIPAPFATLEEFIAAGGTVSDDDVTKEFNFLGQSVTGQCPRIVTRTYQIVDSCDNQATCQHVITQLDDVVPGISSPDTLEFSCIDLVSVPYMTLEEFQAAGGQAWDNCGLMSFSWIADSSDNNSCPETIYRKYQVGDSCLNTAWCYQVLLVMDTIPPVISGPGQLSAVCSGSEQAVYLTFEEFLNAGGNASDNCNLDEGSFTLVSEQSDGSSCPETLTRIYQIADDCGNTSTCEQQVVINDDIPPIITCPPDTVVITWADIPPPLTTLAQFMEAGGSASDNCAVDAFEFLNEEEIIVGLCPRVIKRTYQVADLCGNTATCVQTIYQDDDTPPEVTCPPDTAVYCVEEIPVPFVTLEEFIAAGGTVTDDDVTKEFNFLGQVVSGNCPRIITRTYQVVDSCDNQATCQHVITQHDDVAPDITCPDTLAFTCFEQMEAPYQTMAEFTSAGGQASDNCGLLSFAWVSDSSDYNYCPATIYRKYQVVDSCGNMSWCNQVILINDQVPPEIACQPALTVSCHDDVPAPDISQVVATDNCGVATVAWQKDVAIDSLCINQVTIIRFYVATDLCGNSSTCTQLISVFDDMAPQITCPGPITVICEDDVPEPDIADVGASDNCGTVEVSWVEDQVVIDSTHLNQYVIIRTYLATDECGNTSSCTTTITVHDEVPPGIVCPPDTTVYMMGTGCDIFINIDIPEVYDDCGIDNLVNDYTFEEDASATYPVGVTVVTWIVTDNSGNTASCSMTVTVISLLEAIDDYAVTPMNTPVDINVILNDIYCINILDTNVFNILQPTVFGTLALTDSFGIVTYTPYYNYHGFDQFVYEICDTLGYCDSAVVIIEVLELINHPPVAVDDYAATDFYIPVTIKILENDWDPDGDSIFLVSILSPPDNGELEMNDDQTVTYTPDPGFMGVDVFSYLIRDNGYPILFDSANVYVEVPETPYEEIPFKIYNTLTPNGDGDNDYWKILGIEYFPDNDVILMDRWGEIIHTYDGYNNSTVRWEGKDGAGRLLANGVYLYILEIRNMGKLYKGWVMLHR